jgi:hypothetical protein
MSDLGEALERMYIAPYLAFSTLRATVMDTANETLRWRSIYAQATEQGPGYLAGGCWGMSGDIPPLPEEDGPSSDQLWRLWIETPARIRVERGESVRVRDGELWWAYHPMSGVYSNEEDPSLKEDVGSEAMLMLDPSQLVGAYRFQVLGRETIAGREAICLRREPTAGVSSHSLTRARAARMAFGTFEYAVDRERGLLLREAELFEDKPYWRREVVEIAFDEELPPETFEPLQSETHVAWPLPATEVMLEEAVRLVSFPVFRLALRGEWRCDASYYPGYERAEQPEAVRLHYWLPDATHTIDVEQTPSTGGAEGCEVEELRMRPAGRGGSSGQWERVGDENVREGEYRVTGASVTLNRNGTKITIRAMTLSTDEVLALIRTLVRVPQ